MLPNQFLMFTPPIKGIYTYKHTQKVETFPKDSDSNPIQFL
jgi:hypothetical protein